MAVVGAEHRDAAAQRLECLYKFSLALAELTVIWRWWHGSNNAVLVQRMGLFGSSTQPDLPLYCFMFAQERHNRDNFRQLLQKHRDEGIIAVRMRWKDYAPHVEDTEEYQAVVKNSSGSRPRELFEDLIIEMEEEYEKARSLMKDALKEAEWTAAHDSTYISFVEALDSQAAKATAGEGEHGSWTGSQGLPRIVAKLPAGHVL